MRSPVRCQAVIIEKDIFACSIGPDYDGIDRARTFIRENVQADVALVCLSALRPSRYYERGAIGSNYYVPPLSCDFPCVVAVIDTPIGVARAPNPLVAEERGVNALWTHSWMLIRDVTLSAARRHCAFVVCEESEREYLRLQPDDWLYRIPLPKNPRDCCREEHDSFRLTTAEEDGYMVSKTVTPTEALSDPVGALRALSDEFGLPPLR